MKKTISIIISCVMILSCCMLAHADNHEIVIYETETIAQKDVLNFVEAFEGSDGTTIEPNVIYDGEKLFHFTAVSVQDSLFSNQSDLKFFKTELTNGKLVILARLVNTDANVTVIKAGACYYDPYSDTMKPQVYSYFTNGTLGTRMWDASEFDYYTPYYGFIKNESGVGTVSGQVTLYNASGAIVN